MFRLQNKNYTSIKDSPEVEAFEGNELNSVFSLPPQGQQFQGGDHMSLNELMTRTVKTDPGMENGWTDFRQFTGDFGFERVRDDLWPLQDY